MFKPFVAVVVACSVCLIVATLLYDIFVSLSGAASPPVPVQCPVNKAWMEGVEYNASFWWCDHCRAFHSTVETNMNRDVQSGRR
jgi:hypothetical protein